MAAPQAINIGRIRSNQAKIGPANFKQLNGLKIKGQPLQILLPVLMWIRGEQTGKHSARDS